MLNPTIIDDLIAEHSADVLREMLLVCKLTEEYRAHIIAAIYYLEGDQHEIPDRNQRRSLCGTAE